MQQCRDVVLTGCDFIRNEVRVGRKFQSTFIYGGSVMINTVGEAETPGSQFSAIVAVRAACDDLLSVFLFASHCFGRLGL